METDDSDDENEGINVHDGDGCEYCESIPRMFKALTGIVKAMENHFQLPTTKGQMMYNLQKSEFHIHTFKGYVMWDILAREQWKEFSILEGDGQAKLVVDFPMKYNPKMRKSKTTEWYATAGLSWFIRVFTRRIKEDGKEYSKASWEAIDVSKNLSLISKSLISRFIAM
jgi:hypothetical protein